MTTDAQVNAQECVESELRLLDRGEGISSIEPLPGGQIQKTWLVSYEDGTSVVAKLLHGAPEDTVPLEVEGLAALRATNTIEVPDVVATPPQLLLLAPLPRRDDSEATWEAFARDLAALHQETVHDRFGWDHDNWRGRIRQRNRWTDDGHAFYAEQRLLRYLDEPGAQKALEPADRRAVEHLCERLPEIAPAMPPVLTHGDLWVGNVIGGRKGSLAAVDPSVSYNWAEADLCLLFEARDHVRGLDRFYAAYHELNPRPDGWRDRLPLLALLEPLTWVAHIGLVPLPDPAPVLALLRTTLAPYYVG